MKKPVYIFLALCLLTLTFAPAHAQAAEWQPEPLAKPREMAAPLLPFLDYYVDESGSMDIEEISKESLAGEFKPLVLSGLPHAEGVTWLRFTIAAAPPEARPGAFLLDMGQSYPGVPVLFDAERNQLSGAYEWQEKTPAARGIILLPEEGPQPITCYIRLDGLPGPWFAPVIRTPQNAASNLASLSRSAAILALAVVFLICVLRGLGEKGQWRVWTGLFAATALAQALLGMPPASEKLGMASLAAVLTPGIALMLLPHVGRHLMQTPGRSKSLDIQLFLLSFPGAAIALWPLVPGWAWLDRWTDAWPLLTIIFVPTALGAWIMGLGGSRRFLAACLIPPAFTGFALAGLDFGFPANVLSSLPVWGTALCALLIAATRSPLRPGENGKKTGKARPEPRGMDDVISLERPLDDPNLRLLPAREPESAAPAGLPKSAAPEPTPDSPERAQSLEERENALRAPLDDLMRLAAALGQCSLPPAGREYAENMIASANMLADAMSGKSVPLKNAEDGLSQGGFFSVQEVLRNVHDSVAAFAESAGTALSWYSPPSLERLFRGAKAELEDALYLLLESAVRAAKNGSAHISARRVPGSDDPGHILFSITDNGAGYPPKDRSSLAIARAWEMIGRHGGCLAMEAGPSGVDVALSMRFAVEEEEGEADKKTSPHVILACDDPVRRRALAEALENLPCRVSQAGSAQEVISRQAGDPAGLLIACGQLARPSAADTIRKFDGLARDAGFDKAFALAITADDSQWHLLKLSGFTHAMREPEDDSALMETASSLLGALRKIDPDDPDYPDLLDDLESGARAEAPKPLLEQSQPAAKSKPFAKPGSGPAPRPPLIEEKKEDASFEGPDWLNPLEAQEEKAAAEAPPAESAAPEPAAQPESGPEGGKPGGEPENYSSMMDHLTAEEKEPPLAAGEGDPVVLTLIRNLDSAMEEASKAYQNGSSEKVAEATARIISECEGVGLRLLARMASCVERAARENDMSALSDLLPELGLAVERNRVALNENLRDSRQG